MIGGPHQELEWPLEEFLSFSHKGTPLDDEDQLWQQI